MNKPAFPATEGIPCPFCGSKSQGVMREDSDTPYHWVECYNCRAQGPENLSEEEAKKAWARSAPEPSEEQIDRLVAAGRILERYEDPRLRPLSEENFRFYDSARKEIAAAKRRSPEPSGDARVRYWLDDYATVLEMMAKDVEGKGDVLVSMTADRAKAVREYLGADPKPPTNGAEHGTE